MGPDDDPLVEELVRSRRDRQVLAVAVAIGIVTSVVLGLGAALGSLGGHEPRNHGALAYFLVPLVLSLAIGYGHDWLRRRRAR
ncbi:MAG: hypothetical protein JNL83_04955 [Myxococcales bacterium]|nr:hypothetical protein [Myxococcales bacterium]